MTPRVTVNIPTRNRPELLQVALVSLIEQSIDDWEAHVSDNGDPGPTADLIKKLGDSRIIHAPNETNIGAFANFTRCLQLGSAPFVALLQDDDFLHPTCLERKLSVLEADVAMVLCHSGFSFVDGVGNVISDFEKFNGPYEETQESSQIFLERSMSSGTRILFSAAVMRRELIQGIEFSELDGRPCDLGVWLRAGSRGSIGYINEPLLANRIHPDSDTLKSGGYRYSAGYEVTPESLDAVHAVKLRFLEEQSDELIDLSDAISLAQAYRRRRLRHWLSLECPRRSRAQALKLLATTSLKEPRLLGNRAFWSLLKSALSRRGL